MNLQFGLGWAVPEGVASAWGARLIFPDDLLPNRQALVAENPDDRAILIGWLNGEGGKAKALAQALHVARKASQRWKISRDGAQMVILYQDAEGVIVACPNRSGGYLYVAGWLHNGEAAKMPAAEFEPIVFERDPWEAA